MNVTSAFISQRSIQEKMSTRIILGVITLVILIIGAILLFLDWHYIENLWGHADNEKAGSDGPCENFYTFACKDWKDQNRQPFSTEVKWSVFTKREKEIGDAILEIMSAPIATHNSQPLKLAKQFYKDCVNTDEMNSRGMKPLLALIDKLGSWSLLLPNDTRHNMSLTDSILRLQGMAGWDKKIGFYKDRGLFYVQVNPKPQGGAAMTIYPPTIVMEHIYLKPFSVDDPYVKYRQYIHAVVSEIRNHGFPETTFQSNASDLFENIDRMIRFEARLANAVRLENFETSHMETFTVRDFQMFADDGSSSLKEQHRTIDWVKVLDDISPKVHVRENDSIRVFFPVYFQELGHILGKTHLRLTTIKNFLIWTVVSNVVSETTDTMRSIQVKFQQSPSTTRQEHCSRIIDGDSSGPFFSWIFAVGNEYVERFGLPKDLAVVSDLVDKVRTAFINNIRHSNWIDNSTKENLESHLRRVKAEIGYPAWIHNSTLLKLYYKQLETKRGQHLENFVAFMYFQAEPPDFNDTSSIYMHLPFLSVSPRYTASANTLSIPIGIFGNPYFYPNENLSCTNYGALGTVIGHEMSHAIYTYLPQFANDNVTRETHLWSNASSQAAEAKISCLKGEYENLAQYRNVTLTGSTVQEDAADNVGFSMAYSAFQSWAEGQAEATNSSNSDATSFFLAFARIWCANYGPHTNAIKWSAPHSRNFIRVTGTVLNHPGFSSTWNCSNPLKVIVKEECKLL